MCSIQLSPGVVSVEQDLSAIVPAIATTTAAIVGYSAKGSLDTKLITNRQDFITEYGKPITHAGESNFFHYTALAFLENGTALYCKRVRHSVPNLAGVSYPDLYAGLHVVDRDSADLNQPLTAGRALPVYQVNTSVDTLFNIFAKDPGSWGNSISIKIPTASIKSAWKVYSNGHIYECIKAHTSSNTILVSNAAYWICTTEHIVGYDEETSPYPTWATNQRYVDVDTEAFTFNLEVWFTDIYGISSKVETWNVSRKNRVDGRGRNLFIESRINGYSKYIVVDDSGRSDLLLPKAITGTEGYQATISAYTDRLGGGDDIYVSGTEVQPPTVANIDAGWEYFANPDEIDVRILIGGASLFSNSSASDVATISAYMNNIAATRKDCIAILDVPYDYINSATDTVTYRSGTFSAESEDQAGAAFTVNSSYSALYAPWVKINDSYSDQIILVPPSGYVASQIAYTDSVAYPWNAPAGDTRGVLNVLGVSKIYSSSDRDTLYQAGVNPIQLFRGAGVEIWGQKTLQKKTTALDRVNVRRLLIVLEKSITIALRQFLFEPNLPLTRFRIGGIINQYLAGLSAQGAFTPQNGDSGFMLICNSQNNTPQVIDNNELRVDIFIRPVHCAEFIRLQTIVTTTGASFNELISQGALL